MRPLVRWVISLFFAGALACSSKEESSDRGTGGGAGTATGGGSGLTGGSAGKASGGGSAGAAAGSSGNAGRGGSSQAGSAGRTGAGGTSGASGTNAAGGEGGESAGGQPQSGGPLVLAFKASPATLPDGGGDSTLSFDVVGADTVSIDHGVGEVTGTSVSVNVTETTIFSLTAENASGTTRASTAVVVGARPSHDVGRYVAMISPNPGESFLAPAELRLFAAAYDQNVYTNEPTEGHGGNAKSIEFFVDDDSVGSQDGLAAEYWIFRGKTTGVAAGQHRVWARATYEDPALVLDSDPVLVDVAEPPDYADVVELTADVVLAGATGYELEGSASGRIRLNGNGHRIVSEDGASGKLTLSYVDVFELGDADDSSVAGIDVTTSGAIVVEHSTFDTSNTLGFRANGSATASIRDNTFRSNLREPLGQGPSGPTTLPSVRLGGTSTAPKAFAGNNVGNGAVELESTQNWTIGAADGGSDEDGNVLIGPRVGIHVSRSSDVDVRRNYSHHVYFGGWSQGDNFELQDSPSILVEHNVISGSSWPSRGVACEYRYNLVLDAGHEWLWPANGGSIHHNVFVGGDNDVGGIYVLYEPQAVSFFNNTLDGQLGGAIAVLLDSGHLTLTSNAFVDFPNGPTVDVRGGDLTADYNAFLNPDADDYSDARTPTHDVSGMDLLLHDPPPGDLDVDEAGIWQRTTSAASVLALYRARYTPDNGSPLIDAGDPAAGDGNDIGAIGAGTPNDDDRFGKP